MAGFLEICRIMTIIAIGYKDNMELNDYIFQSNTTFRFLLQISILIGDIFF